MSRSAVIRSYRDLDVWKNGVELALACYASSETFPKREQYGLTSQVRRAAVSIPANIAEGHGRRYTGDYLRFLSVANGSLMELETELLIAERLGFLNPGPARDLERVTQRLGRMLATLIVRLKERQAKRS